MSETRKKMFIMVTSGPENPEMATLPFVMATAAQAGDVDVIMGFQGNGSMLTAKCMPDHVNASGLPRLSELVQTFLEAGGKMHVCGPCAGSRNFKQGDLIEGAEIVGASAFISESLEADQALIY
jgi:predicted peroxiredoxin